MKRMRSPSPSGAQVPPAQHVWTVGPSDRRRYAWLSVWQIVSRPRFVIFWILLATALAAWLTLSAGGTVAVAGTALVNLFFIPALWLSNYRAMQRNMVPGAQWASGFNDYGLMFTTPTGTVILGWDTITAAIPRHGLVIVRTKGNRTRAIGIPNPLFPPAALHYANTQIARRRTYPGQRPGTR